jgi:hypothetical protein
MIRHPRWLLSVAAIAATLLPLRALEATTVVALADGDLARVARTIVHGDVVAKRSFVAAEGGRIYTEYRFAARELLKGSGNGDGTVTFREWGGEVGGVRYWIPGLQGYEVGEEVVAFLGAPDARTGVGFTVGLGQGKFTVEREHATGRAKVRRSLEQLDVVGRPGVPSAQSAPRELDGFLATIRAEVAK